MNSYVDLHLCPNLDDLPNARSMAEVLSEAQVGMIGLVIPPERLTHPLTVVDLFRDHGLDVAKRLNLIPRHREELLRGLRRFRDRYEIIAVECDRPSVSRVAVRDRRVDMVYFPKRDRGNLFRGSLGTTCRAAFETSLAELAFGSDLSARIQSLRRDIEAASKASTAVIGSTKASSPYGLRSPRDIAALLHTMGLPLGAALRGVSELPLEIVYKNRLRLKHPQLEEGVRVVKGSIESG